MSKLYLLNTPILTAYGDWRFSGPVDLAMARELVGKGFISAIGHVGTAELLAHLLGCDVPCERVTVTLEIGDKALIFRVKTRLPEGEVLTREQIEAIPYELGILERLA